jgi:cell division FtsZ-interacting protein ZapD
MALRVTGDEVLEIMDTSLTVSQLETFATAANLLVTAKLGSEGLSTDLLKEIERYLTAHFASAVDPGVSREKIGEAEAYYMDQAGTGLASTRYGQRVLLLDTTGKLARSGSKQILFTAIDLGLD